MKVTKQFNDDDSVDIKCDDCVLVHINWDDHYTCLIHRAWLADNIVTLLEEYGGTSVPFMPITPNDDLNKISESKTI